VKNFKLITSRTPLRITLLGGGTDIPGYYTFDELTESAVNMIDER
jgi:galactokinase/mevalonate kinase-like predicted kinase